MSVSHLIDPDNKNLQSVYCKDLDVNTSGIGFSVTSTSAATALLQTFIPFSTESCGIIFSADKTLPINSNNRRGAIIADATSLRLQTGYQPLPNLPIQFVCASTVPIRSTTSYSYIALPTNSTASKIATSDTTVVLATFTSYSLNANTADTLTWNSSVLGVSNVVRATVVDVTGSAGQSALKIVSTVCSAGSCALAVHNFTATNTGSFNLKVLFEVVV